MGGGASGLKQKRREGEKFRHGLVRAVERFVVNVYAICPRVESMRLILESEAGSKAYTYFVQSECADEILTLYNGLHRILTGRSTNYAVTTMFAKLVATHITPETATALVVISQTMQQNSTAILTADQDDPSYMANLRNLCLALKEETLFIMAREQFHRFLGSKFYKSWRSNESSHAIATTDEDHDGGSCMIHNDEISGHRPGDKNAVAPTEGTGSNPGSRAGSRPNSRPNSAAPSRSNALSAKVGHQVAHALMGAISTRSHKVSPSNKRRARRRDSDFSVRAFINLDPEERKRILGSESWVAALLAAAEGLPLAFSLCSARKTHRGFPVLFVNKFFEKLTGYNRVDVLGKNLKFLQSPFSEAASVTKLSESLKTGQKCSVVITNITKDEKVFRNLVVIRPIFDDKKNYVYVIGIHVDVSREVDGYVSKMKIVNDLADLLPDLVYANSDDVEPEDMISSCMPSLGCDDY
jgi:PAS domain S-box-containing protein